MRGSSLKSQFGEQVLKIDNIWEEIKDPLKASYDRLYDVLWDSPNSKFTLRFYQVHTTGVDQNKVLKNVIPSKSRGIGIKGGTAIEITLNRNDPNSISEFNTKILSAVHYLAKYPYSFTVVKTSNEESLLYASLTEIFDEEFVKTSFSSSPNVIGGTLSSYAVDNYENWKNGYFDGQAVYHPGWNQHPEHWASGKQLWTLMNVYPIFLFSDANSNQFGQNDFAERLVNFFKVLTGEIYEGIDGIFKLK